MNRNMWALLLLLCADLSSSTATTFSFAVSPKELLDPATDVEVNWSNAPTAAGSAKCGGLKPARAFVGMSCGPQAMGVGDTLDQVQLTDVQMSTGNGTALFEDLVALRCEYKFELVFVCPNGQLEAVASDTATFARGETAPRQGRLSLDLEGSPEDYGMVIRFTTSSGVGSPRVRFGLSPHHLNHSRAGSSTTYSTADMCGPPATTTSQKYFRDPGVFHEVKMTPLRPSTQYFYEFGNEHNEWSQVRSFRTPPRSGSKEPIRFIAYGDMGGWRADEDPRVAAARISESVENGFDSFVLHAGDVSYAEGKLSVWDQFCTLIEPFATRVPVQLSVGNHEYDHQGFTCPPGSQDICGTQWKPTWSNYGTDSGGECGVAFWKRFGAAAAGPLKTWYYSFDYGLVHVVAMSSEHDWTPGSAQYSFIVDDLSKVDRTITPWVILIGHRQLYTIQLDCMPSDPDCTNPTSDIIMAEHMRGALDDVLMKYQVNLVLTGHQHTYTRTCPVFRGKCLADGYAPVHLIAGTAGAGCGDDPSTCPPFDVQYGNWSIDHFTGIGFVQLEATEHSLTAQFVEAYTGSIADVVKIPRWKSS